MTPRTTWPFTVLILTAALATPALADDRAQSAAAWAPSVLGPAIYDGAKPQPTPPSQRLGVEVVAAAPRLLPPLDNTALREAADARRLAGAAQPLQTGLVRTIELIADDPAFTTVPTPHGGMLRVAEVGSAGALGLRLHFSTLDLPQGAELWIIDPNTPGATQVLFNRGPFGDGDVWSIIFHADRVRVEYYVPPGVADTGAFVVDQLNHLYRDPAAPPTLVDGVLRDDGCTLDLNCYPQWLPLANATARIDYQGQFGSEACTATLLATTAGDLTPYLLTSNRCVGTSNRAHSVVANWFWRSTMCGGPPVNFNTLPQSAYCDYVAGSAYLTQGGSDQSLLMMRGVLPSGLTWAGWDSAPVADGTAVTTIHHPRGEFRKASFGTRQPHAFGAPERYHGVVWTDGTIEPSSFGAGLYRDDNQLLVGVASHTEDPSFCTNPGGPSGYGRFDVFHEQVADLLAEGPDDPLVGNQDCGHAYVLNQPSNYRQALVLKEGAREDWFRLQVGPCGRVFVFVRFVHAFGDIDLELYDRCSGARLAVARSTTDNETLFFPHTPGTTRDYLLRVMLTSNVRNTYDLTAGLVVPGPIVFQQPATQNVCVFETVTFTVGASSDATQFQWRHNGEALVSDGVKIIGAETPTLIVNDVRSTDAGTYDCVVSNDCALSTTSLPATLTVRAAPQITRQPIGQSANVGSAVLFAIDVDPLFVATYQWLRNGVPVVDDDHTFGAQSLTLGFIVNGPEDAGSYRCAITSIQSGCVKLSDIALLRINGACVGDLNADGVNDLADLGVMFGCWNQPCGDVNGDGATDLADLGVLFNEWNCGV